MDEEVPELYPYQVPMRRPVAWVTWVLLVSTVAVFLLQLLFLHLYGDDVIGNTLAFSPEAFAGGRYWTLLTYAWAHAVVIFGEPDLFWLHIVANMVPLFCLGPALERLLGPWRYLGLYLGGALVSALVWFLFNLNSDEPIIGASGAVFALVAAAGTAAPHTRVVVYLFFILPIPMSLRMLAMLVCGVEAASIVFRWMPEIAHSAHLGGAAFGFIYILVIGWLSPRRPF